MFFFDFLYNKYYLLNNYDALNSYTSALIQELTATYPVTLKMPFQEKVFAIILYKTWFLTF